MLFGRRHRSSNTREGIIEFWAWWPSARPRLTADIDAGEGGASLADEIGQRVAAIHPKLEWELGQGVVSRHGFTVSPAGNVESRAAAARWLALAPPSDDVWEFHDARQPNPGFAHMSLRMDAQELALGDTRFLVSPREHSIDVSVFHPSFPSLPEKQHLHLAFLLLDWALGEQSVEVWIGEISATAITPGQAATVEGLRATLEGLVQRHQEPQWVILGGSTPDTQRLMAVAQVPLRAARWPRFDTHVALTLPFGELSSRTSEQGSDRGNGLPTEEALATLRAFEDSAAPRLGLDGELLAHETGNGIRTLHYYVDGESEAVARLTARTSEWPGARSTVTLDPALKAIRHLDVSR
jgi:hypothetical protein